MKRILLIISFFITLGVYPFFPFVSFFLMIFLVCSLLLLVIQQDNELKTVMIENEKLKDEMYHALNRNQLIQQNQDKKERQLQQQKAVIEHRIDEIKRQQEQLQKSTKNAMHMIKRREQKYAKRTQAIR